MGQSRTVWPSALASIVFGVILVEVTSAIGLKLIGRPIYWTAESHAAPPTEIPLRTEKSPWGAWGVPSSTSRLVGQCFNVEYRFNSMGARDFERHIESPKRWIVLGDSFVEGYGIEQSERLTSIMEERLGWQFSNFGAAGDHGPLQYLLVYRHLAKQLEHHGVIVGFLPFNDFTDNDAEWWREHRSQRDFGRYRPYSILSADSRSYRIIYGVNGDAIPREDFSIAPAGLQTPAPAHESQRAPMSIRDLMRGLSRVSATFSLLRQVSSELSLRRAPYTGGYFSIDQREITAAQLTLKDLLQEIGGRPKIVLLFPIHADLAERRKRGRYYSDQVDSFVSDLRSDGWTVIDVADAISEVDRSEDITLGCDGHWNTATNRMIAEFLLRHHGALLSGEPP